jgi:predicted  nucleic acid-binding Zn-ribbon protein
MRPPAGGFGMMPVDVMARRLALVLELNDSQREPYEQLTAKYTALAEEQQLQRGEMVELGQQLRDARESGDEDRAAEIRTQMRACGEARAVLVRDFFAEVQPLLNADQVQKLDDARQRFEQRFAERGPMGGRFNLLARLPDELQLTDAQREQYDALVSQYQLQPGRRRDQGDAWRTPPDWEGLFTQLQSMLSPEQQAQLATLRRDNARNPDEVSDVRTVLRAAKQLELTAEQKDRLRSIEREAQTADRTVSGERASRAERAQHVKSQVTEILDPNQAACFEQLLVRDQRGPRGQRGQREPGDNRQPVQGQRRQRAQPPGAGEN